MTDTNPNSRTGAVSTSLTSNRDEVTIDAVVELAHAVIDNIEQVIVGHRDIAEHIVITMFARGHLLLEDVPGVGKTMLARTVARSINHTFKRVQFTPDLLPSDVTGVNVFNQQTREFEFQPGPVFANVVLGDEINRAPPKTQSSLLEAMEEEQVTVDGDTRSLPQPFTVIATQNAVEPNRTYELPLAEIDRFMKKLSLGYPSPDDESEVLRRVVGGHPIDDLEPVAEPGDVRDVRARVASVSIEEPVRAYVTRLANYTRENAALGVSPRGSISLLRASQARAALDGRDYVIPDDIQQEAPSVFRHRIQRSTDKQVSGDDGQKLVEAAIEHVPVE